MAEAMITDQRRTSASGTSKKPGGTSSSPGRDAAAASSSSGRSYQGIRPVERQLMRPWLIDQINSGEIPGLQWTDPALKTTFKIPWKHGSRQGWSHESDASLFLRWAQHTGRYRAGENPDPKRWKANFRCAINSRPDIQEVRASSQTRGQNAFRVYQFLPLKPRAGIERTTKRLPRKLLASRQPSDLNVDRRLPVPPPPESSSSSSSSSSGHSSPASSDSPSSDPDSSLQSPMPGSPDSSVSWGAESPGIGGYSPSPSSSYTSSSSPYPSFPSPSSSSSSSISSDRYTPPVTIFPPPSRGSHPPSFSTHDPSFPKPASPVEIKTANTIKNEQHNFKTLNDECFDSPIEWKPFNVPYNQRNSFLNLCPVQPTTSPRPPTQQSTQADLNTACSPVIMNYTGLNYGEVAENPLQCNTRYLQLLNADLPQSENCSNGFNSTSTPLSVSLDLDISHSFETDSGVGSPALDDNSDAGSDVSMELDENIADEILRCLDQVETSADPMVTTSILQIDDIRNLGTCLPAFDTFRTDRPRSGSFFEGGNFLDIDLDIVVRAPLGNAQGAVAMDASVTPSFNYGMNQ